MREKHGSLRNCLNLIQEKYKVSVTINDFTGFIPLDKELDLLMQSFMVHANPYCMQIKSQERRMEKCLNMKKKIYEKAAKAKRSFYGTCHAGVGEWIYPILHEDTLLGVLNVGVFKNRGKVNKYIVRKICKPCPKEYEILYPLYKKSIQDQLSEEEMEELEIYMNFICDYLSLSFEKLSQSYHTETLLKRKHNSSEDFILAHSIQYIQDHFREDIDVKKVKENCHCSESYINHIFKRRTGENIKQYINKLRINEAKELLAKTQQSISEISGKVGFKDPNYFSKVFNETVGIAPKKYHERFFSAV